MARIVGICGPSGSGKTTLANMLVRELGGHAIGLDNYFLLDTPHRKYNEQGKDLELPENTDWNAIQKLVADIKNGNETTVRKIVWDENTYQEYSMQPENLVFLEGFLLFHDEKVLESLDFKVYIDVSDEMGISRRIKRENTDQNENWFKEVTFPEYQSRRTAFKSRANLVLNGEDPLEQNFDILKEVINKL